MEGAGENAKGDIGRAGLKRSADGSWWGREGRLFALLGGLLMLTLGAIVFFVAFQYRMGTLRQMGPGYVPAGLGAILIVLSLLVVIQALRERNLVEWPNWRPFVVISASVLVFAVLLERVGLVPTVLATVIVASQAQSAIRILPTILLAIIIAALSWLIFSHGLNLPLPAFRWRL